MFTSHFIVGIRSDKMWFLKIKEIESPFRTNHKNIWKSIYICHPWLILDLLFLNILICFYLAVGVLTSMKEDLIG